MMFLTIVLIVAATLTFSYFVSKSKRDPYLKERVDYSKDYMNNPIVRNMNERDRNL